MTGREVARKGDRQNFFIVFPSSVPKPLRVVLLGKAGNGKSSLANTIFGNPVFKVSNFDSSFCVSESQTRQVNGGSLTLIDTPGLLAPDHSEEDIKREILRCITECSPGPHAVLIVLKAVISQICQHFSEEVLTHAVVVFTHGDQLPEGMTIQEYVSQSEGLSDLVQKCGGRCHVFDNRYWKNAEQDDYRSNKFQVTQLLNNIDDILKLNNGGHYTNSILQEVEEEIQIEADRIRKSSIITSYLNPVLCEAKSRQKLMILTVFCLFLTLVVVCVIIIGALFFFSSGSRANMCSKL
uniref:AIG1-type G domain-containing protein n=1 Tax=Oryzias melastigma TaxID=30732 RepID=A0A3B3CHC9_ORYME